jgi:hypothetical protein
MASVRRRIRPSCSTTATARITAATATTPNATVAMPMPTLARLVLQRTCGQSALIRDQID